VLTTSHTNVAGDGVPIVYYDFELDSNRATFENAIDQQINWVHSKSVMGGW